MSDSLHSGLGYYKWSLDNSMFPSL